MCEHFSNNIFEQNWAHFSSQLNNFKYFCYIQACGCKKNKIDKKILFYFDFVYWNKQKKQANGISKPADGRLSGWRQAVALIWSEGVVS